MSSRFEGFPSTVAGGRLRLRHRPRDIIRNEVDGLLISPGELVSLKSALDRLMKIMLSGLS